MGVSTLSRVDATPGAGPARKISKHQRLARALHRTGLLPVIGGLRDLGGAKLRILAYHRVLAIPDEDAFKFDLGLVSASSEQFRGWSSRRPRPKLRSCRASSAWRSRESASR